jgi:hypothetical protein
MAMTDQGQTRTNIRRVSTDALIVRGLFVVTVVLLVASAITGWREAHRAPATLGQGALMLEGGAGGPMAG